MRAAALLAELTGVDTLAGEASGGLLGLPLPGVSMDSDDSQYDQHSSLSSPEGHNDFRSCNFFIT